MILLQVLDFELHRNRKGSEAVPKKVLSPAKASFLPAVVSDIDGTFISCPILMGDDMKPVRDGKDGFLLSGVFSHDSDALDDLIDPLFGTAFNLAHESGWPNIFAGKNACSRAFSYVQDQAGLKSQPHVCLVPREWDVPRLEGFFGKELDLDGMRYRKTCRVRACKIQNPVFLSRPDYVGQITQFLGGRTSVVLHNVKLGMAFPLE